MATIVTVYKDAATTVAINVEGLQYDCAKDLQRNPDSDGTNRWTDDNRYVQTWTVTGTISSVADLETLKSTIQIVMGATYPKIRVYDKSAADYYNDYSPVQFTRLTVQRVTDADYRVTCTFQK
jgi:hypothetical protein